MPLSKMFVKLCDIIVSVFNSLFKVIPLVIFIYIIFSHQIISSQRYIQRMNNLYHDIQVSLFRLCKLVEASQWTLLLNQSINQIVATT